ncbi:MAG: hypothetical protein GY799_28560 [Desulfobulbaceae bacterium]|nr:hypothetical protein [Desulfobulbaceae bacterium]
MSNKIIIFLAIFLVIGGAIFFWPSDEKKIRDNLDSLAEYCSSTEKEPGLETLQKVALAAKLCTNPCTVQIESFKIDHQFSRKEITDRLLMMKKRLPNTVFSFHDTVLAIVAVNRAEATITLRLDGETVDGQFTDAYEFNIIVEKKDGNWLFSSFGVVEFMKK